MKKELHIQGHFCGYDKFGKATFVPLDLDKLKTMKKINNLNKGQPDKKLPLTNKGYKISVPKDSKQELDKYVGAPVDLRVRVYDYKLRDKETRQLIQGYSLILQKTTDMTHAHSDIRDDESSE